MESPFVTCPMCDGKKRSLCHVNYGGSRPNEWKMMDCSTCNGAGRVTQEHMQRLEAGRKLRGERVAKSLSLREEAIRLGIKVTELSDMERGRIRDGSEPGEKHAQ